MKTLKTVLLAETMRMIVSVMTMNKEDYVLCAWHVPKAVVNRKTGEPLIEGIIKSSDFDSHGMCDPCNASFRRDEDARRGPRSP